VSPGSDPRIREVAVSVYRVPTDAPESDGTLSWDSTTMVVAEISAGGATGLGYTYGAPAVADLVESHLAPVLCGSSPMDVAALWLEGSRALRNAGRRGAGMMAISAVDAALWDLRGRLLGCSVLDLLPVARESIPVYGSGGFCNYSHERLQQQLAGWIDQGIPRVKMKISRDPGSDPARLDAARRAIGAAPELLVDSNGALTRTQALEWTARLRERWGVTWHEEPVSSDDLEGLRFVRDRAPGGIDVAAGEYGSVPSDFAALVDAVDCLQADVTRCGGITGVLQVGGLCASHQMDLSAHCAPAISAYAFCGVLRARHLEYFHDHVRVERMLFDGVPEVRDGEARPDRSRPGLGLSLRRADAVRYRVR
jgi:L-alanine-DL-glutamate epimerase-like enolase superfamily enzyme